MIVASIKFFLMKIFFLQDISGFDKQDHHLCSFPDMTIISQHNVGRESYKPITLCFPSSP